CCLCSPRFRRRRSATLFPYTTLFRSAKDQEGPSHRGEGIPLESETPREGIVECDGEAGEREGDEKARHDHFPPPLWLIDDGRTSDRKSTRLNSSHEWISYAVFCLNKK